MTLKDYIAYRGLLVCEFLEVTGISARTFTRWQNKGAPKWAYAIVDKMSGNVPGWTSWRSRPGVLTDPEGNEYTEGQIRSVFFLKRKPAKVFQLVRQKLSAIAESESTYSEVSESRM